MNGPAIKRPRVVLYVDDDEEQRELMKAAAKACEVRFGLALANGFYDAIDYLGRQGKYAEEMRYPLATLALLDYRLGEYRGTEITRWIRKQSSLSGLPVVMFSGGSEVTQMAECYVAGADYYIKKPVRFEDLLKVVRGLDACLTEQPPCLAALTEMAADPATEREALTRALKTGLAENQALKEQARVRIAKLDLTMAVRKEVLKKIPFAPSAPPWEQSPDRGVM